MIRSLCRSRFGLFQYLGLTMALTCLSVHDVNGVYSAENVSFQRDIRPILSDHCYACHGPDEKKREADLRLDQSEVAIASGAIVPGDLERSLVWERITSQDPDTVMPPEGFHKSLSEAQRRLLRKWIESGAAYEQHWSFVTPVKPSVPLNGEANPIDAFLQDRLKDEGMSLAPFTDRRTLIRRVTLDLTGLPPTPAEVDAFLADRSEDAYSRCVDGLMNRASYGEHMARFWLDLARYADTHGLHLDNERSMWPYRDWVVRAFQQNLPFDEFTRWQLAGDLLPDPTRDQLIASGFNRCNVTTSEGGSIAEEWVYRYAVDRTTTMAEVWLGLTAGCAVCHDHKFDPLTTREYYSLYSFFHSAADPAMDGNKIDTPPILKLRSDEETAKIAELDRKLADADREVKEALASYAYVDPATMDPPPPEYVFERVLFEDSFPARSKVASDGHPIKLVNADEGPVFTGKVAIQRTAEGFGQDYYNSGADPIVIPVGAKLHVQCYIDPKNLPQAIMLQFHTDAWKHRAVWGDKEVIEFGESDTPSKFFAGKLPTAGEWVELEIIPSKIGLKAGDKITGYSFTQHGGTVTWDHLVARTKTDTTKDQNWSYEVWKERNAAKPVKELPDHLKELVRSKKIEDWTIGEAKEVFDFWKEKIYVGAEKELKPFKDKKAKLEQAKEAIDGKVPLTFVMAELPKPRESYVMIRGAYDKPGEKVIRQVPSFLPPLPARTDGQDYDRLDLANWLVGRQHPLTARVAVNRLWQQFFGIGLVKTGADFGSQGEPPSHPELLDWLAVQFMDDGWDIQQFVKRIVMSRAYRQSSVVSAVMLQRDPENRLLARAPRFRLDAEVLRDQALFVSGLLVDRIGGKPVKPYQPPNIWEPVGFGNSNTRNYVQGSGEDLYRRSLYTFLKRTAPPPFMSTFDAPNREQSCTFRERSNTPMQALQLLNDIQHVEAARNFAARILKEGGQSIEQRIRWAWLMVTSRQPTESELQIAFETIQEHSKRYIRDEVAAKALVEYGESKPESRWTASELATYTLFANLLLNLDETLTKN